MIKNGKYAYEQLSILKRTRFIRNSSDKVIFPEYIEFRIPRTYLFPPEKIILHPNTELIIGECNYTSIGKLISHLSPKVPVYVKTFKGFHSEMDLIGSVLYGMLEDDQIQGIICCAQSNPDIYFLDSRVVSEKNMPEDAYILRLSVEDLNNWKEKFNK